MSFPHHYIVPITSECFSAPWKDAIETSVDIKKISPRIKLPDGRTAPHTAAMDTFR